MPTLHSSTRRALVRGAAAAIALPSLTAFAQAPARQLRIGHQKGYLSLLKGRGTLEKRLAPLNVSLKWTEFTAGPVQLEALNVGSIGAAHRDALAGELAQLWGLPKPVVDISIGRTRFGTGPVTRAILAEQQKIADTFFSLGLIPKQIKVLEAAAPGIA
ncbi:hypothetical protein [Variovorax sp. JS1663]|uniref:hypothetical protein n=1 Tax=Variovorax sp. JS1663 TaxID=1851577 RepID=UPI000B343390|nr:hypothetical protein [Variovorax sp. JS1663]OUM02879.1 hypothetical protein A8M77_08015 [Variovorax sp. JS1663]